MAENRQPAHNLRDNSDDSYLHNNVDPSLLDSPARRLPVRNMPAHGRQPSTQQVSRPKDTSTQQHEASLQQELANVRKVNEAIEGVLASLEKAKSNMKNVNQTVGNASALLNVWSRILSQTEHSQRLILDPTWQGASQDIADMEDEAQAKQQAAERREVEEQERKAAAARKVEEEKQKPETATVTTKPKLGVRGRGGSTRGSGVGRAGYVTMGGASSVATNNSSRGTASTRRSASGAGRGQASRITRGRG